MYGSSSVKVAPPPGGVLSIQTAMVQCGDLRSDGEAESEVGFAFPGCIGAVKALENLGFLRIRDAGAIVADGKAESGIGDIQCQPDGFRRADV